jgi:hypothetical protein
LCNISSNNLNGDSSASGPTGGNIDSLSFISIYTYPQIRLTNHACIYIYIQLRFEALKRERGKYGRKM